MHPNIVTNLNASIARLIAENPELADDAELRADMIEGETDFEPVCNRIARTIADNEALALGAAEYAKQLAARAHQASASADRLRKQLLDLMETAGRKTLRLPVATCSLVWRGPAPIRPDTADDLPDDLVRIKREPNMTAIKTAYEAGELPPQIQVSNGRNTLMMRIT